MYASSCIVIFFSVQFQTHHVKRKYEIPSNSHLLYMHEKTTKALVTWAKRLF